MGASSPAAETDAPAAFLNYLFFNKDFILTRSGFDGVSTAAEGTFEKLELTGIPITEAGYIYIYVSNEDAADVNVYFDDLKITHTKSKIVQMDDYYPFGLAFNSFSRSSTTPNKYLYNGKELQDELDLDWMDYGARMYDPAIGRWHVVDPAADVLEMSTPYAYSLNSPINYVDKDGELPIFINGRVSSDSERGSKDYWNTQLLSTIKNSGIANPGGERHFVDGDRGMSFSSNGDVVLNNGSNTNNANSPSSRRKAGYFAAKNDFKSILAKLARDPESGKIIEKIQIYTHSRGGAFGAGYTASLLKMISDNADQFEDSNNVIQYMLNLAPHQSNSINSVAGVPSFGMSHKADILSGNDIDGATNMSSNVGNIATAHGNGSFKKEVGGFIKSFLQNNEKTDQSTVDDFVKRMKDDYGISVTVKQ